MKKILTGFGVLILAIIIACSSSQEGASQDSTASGETQASSATTESIQWGRFDDGLNAAAAEGKHVVAYFWRDG